MICKMIKIQSFYLAYPAACDPPYPVIPWDLRRVFALLGLCVFAFNPSDSRRAFFSQPQSAALLLQGVGGVTFKTAFHNIDHLHFGGTDKSRESEIFAINF